jgi:hypothetical protein
MDLINIDNELRAKYPNAPFKQIKENLMNDDTAVIITQNQYRALLEYRLKNYRPKLKQTYKSKQANPIRKEYLPDWFE